MEPDVKKITKLKLIFCLVFVFLWNIIRPIPEFTKATNKMHFVVNDIYYYYVLLLLNNIKNVIWFLRTKQKIAKKDTKNPQTPVFKLSC